MVSLGVTSYIDPWSPGGSFMVQKMAIAYPIPVLEGLRKRGSDGTV